MLEIKWIYGDMHLGEHSMFNRIYKDTFPTMEAYHEGIIKNWNRKITSENDIILILGDMGRAEAIADVVPKLRGRKWLILGNHDNYPNSFYEKYFEKVFTTPIFVRDRIVISHHPIPVEDGVINIHGHTHHVKLKSKLHFNLCPEWWAYEPIQFKRFEGELSKIPRPNRKFLYEWYADIQIPHTKDRDDLVLKKDGTIDVEASRVLVAKLKAERELERVAMKAAQEFLESNLDN